MHHRLLSRYLPSSKGCVSASAKSRNAGVVLSTHCPAKELLGAPLHPGTLPQSFAKGRAPTIPRFTAAVFCHSFAKGRSFCCSSYALEHWRSFSSLPTPKEEESSRKENGNVALPGLPICRQVVAGQIVAVRVHRLTASYSSSGRSWPGQAHHPGLVAAWRTPAGSV